VSSDAELLERWRSGDARSGSELFERHFRSLSRFFAAKVGDDIDDVLQSTFLACVEGRHRIREGASFRAYLFAIARRELFAHWRRRRTEPLPDPEAMSAADLGPSPSGVVGQGEEQRLVLEGLRRLPIDQQIVLELTYWEDLSDREIADVLDVPHGTVKSRIRRARLALDRVLGEIATSPALLESTRQDLDGWARQLRDAAVRSPRQG
jgi:RNA polymerase sigma-70 factor (ECF subfamily)